MAEPVRTVLTRKCAHKAITFPQLADLDAHKDVCATGWQDQLGHQLQVLPPFDSFWGELPQFFAWLEHPEQIAAALPAIPSPGAVEVTGITAPAGTPQLGMLDHIRFAAVNRLCVEIDYRKENGQRQRHLIEPYSLRTTAEGHRVLYGVKLPSNETRSFRTDRIIAVNVTSQAFAPRFSIDFIPSGPVGLSVRPASSQPSQHRPRAPRPRRPEAQGRAKICFPLYYLRQDVHKVHSQLPPEPAQEQAGLGLLRTLRLLRQDKILARQRPTRTLA